MNCIQQDSKGLMSFSTGDGLDKDAGYSFSMYRHEPNDPHNMDHNHNITSLYKNRFVTLSTDIVEW